MLSSKAVWGREKHDDAKTSKPLTQGPAHSEIGPPAHYSNTPCVYLDFLLPAAKYQLNGRTSYRLMPLQCAGTGRCNLLLKTSGRLGQVMHLTLPSLPCVHDY